MNYQDEATTADYLREAFAATRLDLAAEAEGAVAEAREQGAAQQADPQRAVCVYLAGNDCDGRTNGVPF